MKIEFFSKTKLDSGTVEYIMEVDGCRVQASAFNGEVGLESLDGCISDEYFQKNYYTLKAYISLYKRESKTAGGSPESFHKIYYNCSYKEAKYLAKVYGNKLKKKYSKYIPDKEKKKCRKTNKSR